MIEICIKEKCTGCGMCSNICDFHAIEMVEDNMLGHYCPEINPEKCRECAKCQRLCPANNRPEQKSPIVAYAAWSEDAQERKTSSSGGIVAALYRAFIQNGGNIVGAYLDREQVGHLKVTCDVDWIASFKGSKYVQVKSEQVYSECLELLKDGKQVLFTGTPCQCAAMKNCAGRYSDNLFLIELICHGVPSPVSWRMHFMRLNRLFGDRVSRASFRSEKFSICLSLMDSKGKTLYQRNKEEDQYLLAFLNGELFAECCFQCPYARKERVADLVVGDFWGVGQKADFPYTTKKVSVIGVISEKGKKLLSLVDTIKLVEREYEEAVEGNPQLRAPFVKPIDYCIDDTENVEKRIAEILYSEAKNQLAEKNYKTRRRKEIVSLPIRILKKLLIMIRSAVNNNG